MSTMYTRIMIAFVAGAFLIGLPAFIQAEPDEGMHHRGMHHGVHAWRHHAKHHVVGHVFHSLFRHAKDLGLSEEQVTKLHFLKTGYEKARIREEANMKLDEVDVRTLAHDQKAEMSAIENAVRKAEMEHANLRIEEIRTLRAALAVLTLEQREKWRAIGMERRGERHAEGPWSRAYGGDEPMAGPHGDAQSDEESDELRAVRHDLPERKG